MFNNVKQFGSRQLTIFEAIDNATRCQHISRFVTKACVPAGVVCSDCGELLLQYLPVSPAVLGYVSADWAWIIEHGYRGLS